MGLFLNALASGAYWTGATVFFLPITRDLGLSRVGTSMAFSLARLEGGLGGPLVGHAVDRFGARTMLLLGGVVAGLGFLLLSLSQNYVTFLLIYVGIVSVGFNAGFNNALSTAINSWFIRRRGMAMSVVSSGISLGGAVVTPLIALIIFHQGWRAGAAIAGAAILAASIPVSYYLRSSPESMGMLPDGDDLRPRDAGGGRRRATSPSVDFTAAEAAKTASYWLLAAAIGLRIAAQTALLVHMVPILVWKGQDEVVAPIVVSIMSFGALPLRFVFGYLSDVWSRQKVASVGMAMGGLSVLVLLASRGAFWQLVVFAVMLAFAESVSAITWALIGDFYGRTSFATLRGGVTTVHSVFAMGTPVYAGWVFDQTASYTWALAPIVLIYAAASFLFWVLPKPRIPARLATDQDSGEGGLD